MRLDGDRLHGDAAITFHDVPAAAPVNKDTSNHVGDPQIPRLDDATVAAGLGPIRTDGCLTRFDPLPK